MKTDGKIRRWLGGLPPPAARALLAGCSLLAGLAAALVLHYIFYRIGLPSEPFIYVSF